MAEWEFLESVLFFYRLRNSPQHPQLVESARQMVKATAGRSKKPTLDKVLVLLSGDKTHLLYDTAFQDYQDYYDGMTNMELYDYARYLAQTFGLERTVEKIAVPKD